MRIPLGVALAFTLIASAPAFSQPQERHEEGRSEPQKHAADRNPPRANGGHIPPPPPARANRDEPREAHKFEDGRVSDRPHVSNNHWYGHEPAGDARFHIDHPWEHGRFARFGPSYRYRVLRVDLDHRRFWFPGGFYFEVAPWDWVQCADWCWTCGADDLVLYEDTDHVGWYLVYNVHTGLYVHAQFLGH
jgi:hypothetical protein